MYKESSGMCGFSSTQHLREKKIPGKIQFVNRYIVILLVFFFNFAIAKLVIFDFFKTTIGGYIVALRHHNYKNLPSEF
jgi:hypothetical protein